MIPPSTSTNSTTAHVRITPQGSHNSQTQSAAHAEVVGNALVKFTKAISTGLATSLQVLGKAAKEAQDLMDQAYPGAARLRAEAQYISDSEKEAYWLIRDDSPYPDEGQKVYLHSSTATTKSSPVGLVSVVANAEGRSDLTANFVYYNTADGKLFTIDKSGTYVEIPHDWVQWNAD